jgi:4-hydroxy-3-methylbut-2-en-1-yl diphosphate reductase
MQIILASPRGFCAGVNMAVESLSLSLKYFGPPIYVYHEIVHNQFVVNSFKGQGVVFVNDLAEIPEGSTVLFSAHGVSPEIRRIARERSLMAIDATCPLVTKVHLEAIKFARDHYSIILIGHNGHDEVIGTMGEAPESIVLVEDCDEVDQLNYSPDTKLAYLTQTTLSVDDANRIIDRLKLRFPWIEGPNKGDVCYATQNRQEAVRLLCQQADVVIVLGSQNSSNSLRLRELGMEYGKPSYLIDGPSDLRPEWFNKEQTVFVTAGASAPESVVESTIRWLQDRYGAEVREDVVRREEVHFPLPKVLREIVKQREAQGIA